jgi:hypothetical protein
MDACLALTAAANSNWQRAQQYWVELETQQEQTTSNGSNANAVDSLGQVGNDAATLFFDVQLGKSTASDLAYYNIDLAAVSQFTAGC